MNPNATTSNNVNDVMSNQQRVAELEAELALLRERSTNLSNGHGGTLKHSNTTLSPASIHNTGHYKRTPSPQPPIHRIPMSTDTSHAQNRSDYHNEVEGNGNSTDNTNRVVNRARSTQSTPGLRSSDLQNSGGGAGNTYSDTSTLSSDSKFNPSVSLKLTQATPTSTTGGPTRRITDCGPKSPRSPRSSEPKPIGLSRPISPSPVTSNAAVQQQQRTPSDYCDTIEQKKAQLWDTQQNILKKNIDRSNRLSKHLPQLINNAKMNQVNGGDNKSYLEGSSSDDMNASLPLGRLVQQSTTQHNNNGAKTGNPPINSTILQRVNQIQSLLIQSDTKDQKMWEEVNSNIKVLQEDIQKLCSTGYNNLNYNNNPGNLSVMNGHEANSSTSAASAASITTTSGLAMGHRRWVQDPSGSSQSNTDPNVMKDKVTSQQSSTNQCLIELMKQQREIAESVHIMHNMLINTISENNIRFAKLQDSIKEMSKPGTMVNVMAPSSPSMHHLHHSSGGLSPEDDCDLLLKRRSSFEEQQSKQHQSTRVQLAQIETHLEQVTKVVNQSLESQVQKHDFLDVLQNVSNIDDKLSEIVTNMVSLDSNFQTLVELLASPEFDLDKLDNDDSSPSADVSMNQIHGADK